MVFITGLHDFSGRSQHARAHLQGGIYVLNTSSGDYAMWNHSYNHN